jgi:hypothetical protein
MKKIIYIILLAFVVTISSKAQTVSPFELENLALEKERDFERDLKDHYKKMAYYSEQAQLLAESKVENLETHVSNLKYNIDQSAINYLRVEDQNEGLRNIIVTKDSTISHFEQVIIGYENSLYEQTQLNAIEREKNIELENRLNRSRNRQTVAFYSLLVCCILWILSKVFKGDIKFKLTPKPTNEKLTVVPKSQKQKERDLKNRKKANAKVEKAEKKAKVEEATVEEVPKKSRFSLFIDEQMKHRDLKRQIRLEKRKTKALTQSKGDTVEKITDGDTEIQTTNKNLLGGVLGKMIKTICKTKPPKETPKAEPKPKPKATTTKKPNKKPNTTTSTKKTGEGKKNGTGTRKNKAKGNGNKKSTTKTKAKK